MSASPLSQSVQEAIRQNLSGVVAGELSDFIEKAKRQETELERTKAAFASLNAELDKLKATLDLHRALAEREREMEARENAALEKEIALIKREAGLDARIAQAELGGVKYSLEAFLRNATVRETVVANVSKPVQGSPGGNGYGPTPGFLTRDPVADTTTTTRTAE